MTTTRTAPSRSSLRPHRNTPSPLTGPDDHTARADRGAVHTAVALVVILTAGAYLPSTLYPGYQHAFGFDDFVMTWLFATFALVTGPTLLLCGSAADALGYRPVLRVSLLCAAVGSGCFALADNAVWLFAGRVGQALALGAATGAAQALITRHRSPAARVGGPLLATAAFVAGTAAGPAVSGVLAHYVPGPLLTPYLLHLMLLAWVWNRLRRTVSEPVSHLPGQRGWRPTRPRIPASARALFWAAGLNGFLAWAVVGIYLALVPSLLARTLRNDDPALTGVLLAGVLICSLLTQLAAAQHRAHNAQRVGLAALIASLLLLAATGSSSLPATLGAAALAGAGHGPTFSGAVRAVAARTPDDHHAGTGAALYLLFYLGSGTPAVIVGILTTSMSLTTAVTHLGWVGAGLGVLAWLATGRDRSRTDASSPAGIPPTRPTQSAFPQFLQTRR